MNTSCLSLKDSNSDLHLQGADFLTNRLPEIDSVSNLQALLKGASPAIIGVIISSAPLTVAVLSPVLGYLV